MNNTYNTENRMEQGGGRWVIGGELVVEDGAVLDGIGFTMPNIATPASDANAAAVRSSLIALFTALKNAGLMDGDTFTMSYAAVTNDNESVRAGNTAKISSVSIEDDIITITLSDKVKNLADFDARGEWGTHKWLGIGLSVGISPITGLKYNGSQITAEDVTEATNMGLSAGYFVRWVAADLVLAGDNSQKSKDTFTLWADGYELTEYKLRIVEPTE